MRSPLKAIGVFSIVTTTMVPSGLLAQAYLSDATVCRRAINSDRSGWVEGFYAEEASRRGLAFRACDEMNNPPVRNETEENDETYNSPVTATREQREFLEAATYFITALDVDSGRGDVVSGTQIEPAKYPIVICIGNSGCAVRLRTTTWPYTIWQFDFCKITHWRSTTRYGHYSATWFGGFTAFCIYRGWDRNENYTGDIGPTNSRCGLDGQKNAVDDEYNTYRVWHSLADINDLVDVNGKGRKFGDYSRRPVDRMIASFKYILTLLTGKPY